jgi:hypothetical protein
MTRQVGRTADGRYVVVDGRRWRTADRWETRYGGAGGLTRRAEPT